MGKGILWIGFSIQIVCGLIWMCFHFAQRQVFAPVSGGLYPVLMRVFDGLPQALYLLQLALACGAGYLFLKPIAPAARPGRIWCVLALLTTPVAMQCHLALLPDSFAGSLFLLELYVCRNALNAGEGVLRELAKAGVCWILLAGLLPEYGWLGALPLSFVLLFGLLGKRIALRRFAQGVILAAVLGGLIGAGRSLWEEENARPFWFSAASRFAWPTLWEDAPYWSEGLRAATGDVLWEAAGSPYRMETLLRPAVENERDDKTVRAYYREMVQTACGRHLPQIAKQIVWDALTYAAPLSVLRLQLSGRGYASCSGANYEQMFLHRPLLAKGYVSYSCWWFFVSLAVSALSVVCALAGGERPCGRKNGWFWLVVLLSLVSLAAFYTLRGAGAADYKKTIAAAQMWVILALYGMRSKPYDEKAA